MEKKEYNVLFVCLGNICRSPAAEGIFKQLIDQQGLSKQIGVDSAGTSGWHNGELPDPRMRSHGKRRGYNFDSHSRKFTASDFDRFDLIVVMDDNNYYDAKALAPDLQAEQKVRRMTEFTGNPHYDHIPDPYYMGADGFELVIDLLEAGCNKLLEFVKGEIGK